MGEAGEALLAFSPNSRVRELHEKLGEITFYASPHSPSWYWLSRNYGR
jgi:hypothetical protein